MSQADERREWVLRALDLHEVRLVRYALRLLGDMDLARDAVQHAFLKLCDRDVAAGEASGDDRLAAWLFRVCRNRALDHLRQAGREKPLAADGDDSAAAANRLIGREFDPADAAEAGELAEQLRLLIDGLPATQREAIDLWCEGFAYRQIAAITDHKEGHVRVLVHRGLTRLREHPQVRAWGDPACRAGS